MGQKFVNNLTLRTSADITNSTSSIPVVSTAGLPVLGVGDWMYVTLTDIREGGELRWEVVKLSNYSSNTLSVTRGQDGTAGQAWLAGSSLNNRITAGDMQELENFKDASRSITLTGDVTGAVSYTGTGSVSIGTTIASTKFAPVVSPALTGTPTAPTASAGTNTTQLATTAFVTAADNTLLSNHLAATDPHPQYTTAAELETRIAALVASAPATLDTLNELATALGNDPNFATTVTNALAGKAPIASPALTGTPTAPTATAGTSTTQLATTAFVTAVNNNLQSQINTKAPIASPVFTGQVFIPEGTASAPGLTFQNDGANDTGLYHISDGNIGVTCNAVNVVSFTPTGANLLGTPTAPTASAGTSTSQLATTAFVTSADNNLQSQINGKQNYLGFTPVQQGTGIGQSNDTIKLGWSGSRLKATVNNTDLGNILTTANVSLSGTTLYINL